MTQSALRTLFKNTVNGVNLMTQEIVGYYGNEDVQIELSKGFGVDSDRIYGLTVVVRESIELELGGLHHSKESYKKAINKILEYEEIQE